MQDREILLLRFVDGLDYKEISAALQIPVGTAKWRVFNSKIKLAAELRKAGTKQ
jgi:DNA-directed RNA polymerase specialized sigma24 family protein